MFKRKRKKNRGKKLEEKKLERKKLERFENKWRDRKLYLKNRIKLKVREN